jgi:rSAM/selenodomain-associated transferase 1
MDDGVGRNELIMLSRFPEPGKVKTRLCSVLSESEAASVHEACVRESISRFGKLSGITFLAAVTPDDQLSRFGRLFDLPTSLLLPQGVGELGERLSNLTKGAVERGANRVILLGSDSPTLPISHLLEGFERLDDYDVTLGPCQDGGYYLLGTSILVPALFEDISWGTDKVAAQTKRNAEANGLSLHELGDWYDIDRPEELSLAAVDLASDGENQESVLLRLIRDLGFGGGVGE